MSIEAMKMALDALEQLQGGCTDSDDGSVEAITVWCPEVIDALRQAIEQAEQAQPVVLKAIEQAEQAQPVVLKPCWYESKEMKMCRKCGQVHAEAIIDTAPPPRQP